MVRFFPVTSKVLLVLAQVNLLLVMLLKEKHIQVLVSLVFHPQLLLFQTMLMDNQQDIIPLHIINQEILVLLILFLMEIVLILHISGIMLMVILLLQVQLLVHIHLHQDMLELILIIVQYLILVIHQFLLLLVIV